MISKEEARAAAPPGGVPPAPGRIAEQVRRLAAYRKADRVFVTPEPILQQVRSNVLTDGKELLMPSPRLREGLYLLAPYTVPYDRLGFAVSSKGMAQYGRRIAPAELAASPVGLLLTAPLAVDEAGGFVGDGKGYFDLAVAILAASRALAAEAAAYGVGAPARFLAERLPLAPWDVRLAGLVTPDGLMPCAGGDLAATRISWPDLPPARIRKITPLWQLAQRKQAAVDPAEKSG